MLKNGEKHVSVASTQSLLKERLRQNVELPQGYAILADLQTEGRGRGDHRWVSVAGNLHASIFLRDLPFSEVTWIPLWVSVCTLGALHDLGVDSSRIQLKWPNDLWIDRSKKAGGILCEKIASGIVAGIGLNLVAGPILDRETGAISAIAKMPDAETVLEKIILHLGKPISVSGVAEIYQRHALFKAGDPLQWTDEKSGRICLGTLVDLGVHGELRVRVEDQEIALFVEEVQAVKNI